MRLFLGRVIMRFRMLRHTVLLLGIVYIYELIIYAYMNLIFQTVLFC